MTPKKTRSSTETSALIYKSKNRVAVITPAGAGSYGEIVEGVREGNRNTIDDDRVFAPIPYYTHDVDFTSTKIAVRQAIEDGMVAIITVGAAISQNTKTILQREAPHLPLICVMAGEPVKTGLIPFHNDPESNLVVVNPDNCNMSAALNFMHNALPHARHILLPLPLGCTSWHDEYVPPIEQFCSDKKLSLTIVKDESMHDLFGKVERGLSSTNVLFVPEGHLILDMHRNLGALCDRKRKPFFVGHDWAVRTSAALGYAMSFMPLGELAVKHAVSIIFDGKRAADIPYQQLSDRRHPMINETIAHVQGIDGSQLKARLMDDKDVEYIADRR